MSDEPGPDQPRVRVPRSGGAGHGNQQRDLSALPLGLGVLACGWAVAILLPDVRDLPAWPAATLGALALASSRLPGRALPRGLGMFLGALGLLVGVAKILALWGLLHMLDG